ncbi:hypothetical protein [Enterobacter sichuanensis]|uniref:hypothetical protein n=1 Tax=Enterobacter sichuanensis TaxID=2071710 RepID=UPI0021CF23FF|nr:hypothetical protein [Enterobacter sichuanensis]MCU6194882.1 hypothetical protein [Enterobacter sichuanensis]
MNADNTGYGWLFSEPAEEISGDIVIDPEHLPEEFKLAVIRILLDRIDRDTAEKKLTELIQKLEFDITAAELSAYLFKPGHA